MLQIGIIGGGFVGKATMGFKNSKNNIIVYDINPELCIPKNTTLSDIYHCDIVFICVPTPMKKDGSCCVDIVQSIVTDLQQYDIKYIVVRSTVSIGINKKLGTIFIPEFLTERNWKTDFYSCPTWIVGNDDPSQSFSEVFKQLLNDCKNEDQIISDDILVLSTMEAECVKYTRNCFLATKVSFFNEIFSLCEHLDINYDNVRNGVITDKRIHPSHTIVPNEEFFNGNIAMKKGFGGTCFIKDMSSLIYTMHSLNIPCPILENVFYRNHEIDRPEHDWLSDKGRVIVKK